MDYLDQTFGFQVHLKVLKLFAAGEKLEQALPEATGVSLEKLNAGQLEFLKKALASVRLRPSLDEAALLQLELAAQEPNAPAQALADYAGAQFSEHHLAQARDWAKRALAKDPKCAAAQVVLGRVALEDGDQAGAKTGLEAATALDPDGSFAAWQALGMLYKKEGRTRKAIDALEAARRIYPRYIGPDNPYYELPGLYAGLEPPELEKALQVWRDAVKLNSADPEAALNGLKLALKQKAPNSAVEFAEAYIEIDPYSAEVHRLAGSAYADLNQPSPAEREYSVATVLAPQDVASWIGLARVRKALGRKPEAQQAVRKALDIDATDVSAKTLLKELE